MVRRSLLTWFLALFGYSYPAPSSAVKLPSVQVGMFAFEGNGAAYDLGYGDADNPSVGGKYTTVTPYSY